MRMNKKVIAIGLVLVVPLMTLGSAVPTNVYQAIDVTGTITRSSTSVLDGSMSLGNLSSGEAFNVTSSSGSITVAEASGLNVSEFLMAPWDTPYYWQRFDVLNVKLTIDDVSWTVPILMKPMDAPENNGWHV
jgi:hypothetical protein